MTNHATAQTVISFVNCEGSRHPTFPYLSRPPRHISNMLPTVCLLFTLPAIIFAAKDRSDRLPVISIPDQGDIKGVEISKNRVHKIIAYYGIPYAHPPLEHLRFAPPMTDPLPSWEGVRNLTTYMPSCLQNPEDYRDEDLPFFNLIGNTTDMNLNEDCLYLNVFVPTGKIIFPTFADFLLITHIERFLFSI